MWKELMSGLSRLPALLLIVTAEKDVITEVIEDYTDTKRAEFKRKLRLVLRRICHLSRASDGC